jgi:hypothetical protein
MVVMENIAYRMKSIALALISFLAVKITAVAGGFDYGTPSPYTPYERYMSGVRSVLGALDERKPDMERVKGLMKQGRSFRYHMDDPYRPAMPQITARTREGDCKDKALWLCDQLNDASVRFVIGKTTRNARMSHAWVMWENQGRWWILDCTLKSAPIAADTVPSDRYIPLYSYGKSTCFRHSSTRTGLAAVATQKNAPVGERSGR